MPNSTLDVDAMLSSPGNKPAPSQGGPLDVDSTLSQGTDGFTVVPFSSDNPYAKYQNVETPPGFTVVPFGSTVAPSQDEGFTDKVKDIWASDQNPLGKLWDTINTPIADLKRDNAHGIEAGAEEFASGLTSPLSIGLTLATFGAGGLLEKLGIDVAKMATPEVLQAAKTVSKLASVGFTAGAFNSIRTRMPELNQALQDHDWDKVEELGTNLALNGGLAGLGLKHTVKEFGLLADADADASTIGSKDRILAIRNREVSNINQEANQIVTEGKKAVPDPIDREALHFYGEVGGDQQKLADYRQRVTNATNIAPDLQRQVLRDLDRAMNLNPDIASKAMKLDPETGDHTANLRDMYDAVHERATAVDEDGNPLDTHVMNGDNYRENFFARAPWEHEPAEADAVQNARERLGSPGTDHTQSRVFETTLDGILHGLKPRKVAGKYMLDAYDLGADYYRAMGKEVMQKQLVEFAKNAYDSEDGRPLAVPGGVISKFDESIPGTKDEDSQPTGKRITLLDGTRLGSHALTKAEIAQLTKSGALQEMIADGRVIDRGARAVEPAARVVPPLQTTSAEEMSGETDASPADEVGRPDTAKATAIEREGSSIDETNPSSPIIVAIHSGSKGIRPAEYEAAASGDAEGRPDDRAAEDKYYPGRYQFSTDDYNKDVRNQYAWTSKFAGTDGETTYMQRAPLAFHPAIAKTMQLILDPKKSWVEKNPTLSSIMSISNNAKKSLLSLSGFHWGQIGLRGIESGVNPLKPVLEMSKGVGGWDLHNPTDLKFIESGVQTGFAQGASLFNEGLRSGAMAKVPAIGKVLDSANEALFGPNGYIDRMKREAAYSFFDRLKEKNPELTDDQRFKVASQLANYRFGGLDYLAMGRDKGLQDTLRLVLLAPDWLESNMRDALSTMGPYGKLSRFDLARIAAYNFVAAQTLNVLNTGKMHPETPFGVVSRDGKKVYSIRTMPQDIYHALTEPMDFVSNRLNPLLSRTAVEAITGRDKEGRIRDTADQLKDLISNTVPIPLQGVANAVTGNYHPGESGGDYMRSAAGLTSKPNNSPAEALAYRFSSERSKSGELPSEDAAHFHRVMELEDRMRDGDQSAVPDLTQGLNSGKLSIDDYRHIMYGAQRTRLEAVVNRLPMPQAVQVWQYATKAERQSLLQVMAKKVYSYRKSEAFKLTPQQQARIDVKLAQVAGEMLPDTESPSQ